MARSWHSWTRYRSPTSPNFVPALALLVPFLSHIAVACSALCENRRGEVRNDCHGSTRANRFLGQVGFDAGGGWAASPGRVDGGTAAAPPAPPRPARVACVPALHDHARHWRRRHVGVASLRRRGQAIDGRGL